MVAYVHELQAGLADVVRASRCVRVFVVVGVEVAGGEEIVDEDGVVDDEKADEESEIWLKE